MNKNYENSDFTGHPPKNKNHSEKFDFIFMGSLMLSISSQTMQFTKPKHNSNLMKTITNQFVNRGRLGKPILLTLFILMNIGGLFGQKFSTGSNWSNPLHWSPNGIPVPGDDVVINVAMNCNEANVQINSLVLNNGNLTIQAGNTGTFEVLGQVTINASWTFNDSSPLGVNRFSGGIVNNGTFTSSSAVEFFGANQQLTGSNVITCNSSVTIFDNITLINNNAGGFYIGAALDGVGLGSTFQNNTITRYNGTQMPFLNSGFLNASTNGNSFRYVRGGEQTVRPTVYHHLQIEGSGNKNFSDLTVNGNFFRSGGTVLHTGTIKFSGTSDATYSNNATNTWDNIVIEKTGASLTLFNSVAPDPVLTTTVLNTNTLTIALGTLNLGVATIRTLTVNSDFAGAGKLDASGANHNITLRGENNAIGEFITGINNAIVNYSLLAGPDQQIMFSSPNYKNITLINSAAGTKKVLGGPISVSGIFRWNANFFVELGAFDLTFTNTGTIESSTVFPIAQIATPTRMFVTEGLGKVVIQRTTAGGFTTFNTTTSGIIPIGASGQYNAMRIISFAGGVTGTGSISVRVLPDRQPNIPYFNNTLQKHWKVETTNLSGINANVSFIFRDPADVIGNPVFYETIVYDGSNLVTPNAPLNGNPFGSTSTNFLTGDWTYYDPTVRTTLYSYQSGDWADPLTWTTDPSGTTSVFPLVPGAGDAVVILNGRNVFTNIERIVGSLNIQEGGTLDLRGTTGNNFGPITGQGTLRLSSVNLPIGNLTQFVSSTGGTIEYYNLGAGGPFDLPSAGPGPFTNVYNNLLVTNSSGTAFELRTNVNIVLNGNFSITRSGSAAATFRLGNASVNTGRTFTVNGNFNVGTACTFTQSNGSTPAPSTSPAQPTHTLRINGNSTISGNLILNNTLAYNNNQFGKTSVIFGGATANTTFFANAGCDVLFWDVTMDKTEGSEIFLNGASGTIAFNRNPGVRVQTTNGTMRLGSGIVITLGTNDGENYNIGAPNFFPVLWIDGANVTFAGGNSIVPYGTLKITSGNLDVVTGSGNKTITLRENGLLQVDGGTINMACLRISNTNEIFHRGAYIQSGGTVNVTGVSSVAAGFAMFALPQPENVFKMSGGVLSITRNHTNGITLTGGLHIASSPQNYEVTGGTVNLFSSNGFNNDISTTAPLYDVNVYATGGGAVRLRSFDWAWNSAPSGREPSGAFPLRVLNNFIILSTGNPTFDAGDQDVIVNGNMTVSNGARYISGNNTLRFENSSPQTFTVNGVLDFFGTSGNLINGPEDIFPSANYSFENLTSTQNVEPAPLAPFDLLAERLMETTANAAHRFYTPFIPTSNTEPITASIYVKANGRNFVSLQLGSFNNRAIAYYNLTGAGSVISTNAQVISANITFIANGWYRITATSLGANDYRFRLNLSSTGSNDSYAGNTSLGIFAWGLLVEPGLTASAYGQLPTDGAINSLAVTKTGAATLTIAGSVTSLNLNGSLALNSGLLNIGAKSLNIRGNVINNSEIQATTAGRVRLNGINTQNISGDGNGIFPHLVLANTGGVDGNVRYTSTANFRVLNSLEMNTNRIFSIGNSKITFAPAAQLQATSGGFNNNKFIRTSGFLSDGGLEKEYNAANSTFTYAFGTGNFYTPATIGFSANPTTYGALNVRPVAVKHLYVTDPDAMDYYWKVNQTGFSGIGAGTVNAVFTYGDIAVNPTITSYVPGYYNFADIAYTTIPDVNAVNEAAKTITFTPFSRIAGDFTAGIPAAFGAVIPYYSRTTGNWNSVSTWSNTGHGGAIGVGIPAANNPVYIGDGNSFNHNVTVTTNNTLAGSLIVDNGSTLTLGTTTGHNFGALPFSTAGGAGTIRISSSVPTAEWPGGDFGLFFTNQGGTADYYGTGSSFTLPTTTAAPNALNITTYKNLIISSGGTESISLPETDLTILQNMTINGSPLSIATLNNNQGQNLNINGNLIVNSGIFSLPSNAEHTINANGNITINNSGTFRGSLTGSSLHQVNLLGNFTNNGVLDFNTSSPVSLNLIGNASATFGGTNGGAQTNFGPLTINKGTNQTLAVNLTALGSISAATNAWLNLMNGRFVISRPTTLTLTDQPDVNFFIPATAALVLNHADLTVNVAQAASNTSELVIAGRLELQAGTMNVGNNSNNNHNDIEYTASGTPEIIVSGNSTLNVNGQIRRSLNVLLGSLNYTQSGNSTVLVRGKNPIVASFNLNRAKFEILNEGSQMNMSGNALLIIDRNGSASNIFGDIYIQPASSNITGGEIRVGTGNTAASTTFDINSTANLWNLTVDGTTTIKTLRLNGNPLTVLNNLSVLGESVFNANSLNVNIGKDLLVQNSSAATGLAIGGYRVASANQITTFNGNLGNQAIIGNGSNLINFANLVINNTFSGGVVSLNANSPIRVNSNLSLLNGTFATGGNLVTVLGNVVNNVLHTSTAGGYIFLNGPTNQTISGNGNGQFGNVRVNNTAGIETLNPTRINGDLNLVNGLFYINNHQLTLGNTATVTSPSTLNADRMIRLNGVASDGGVRKLYNAGAGSFTFPVGVTLKYTPATLSVLSNVSAGEITIKPVNAKHPATTDPANAELTYHWVTSRTGFSAGALFTHVYNYVQTDANLNGDENLYVAGRYFSNQWVPQNGIPGTVNATANTITLTNVDYVNGEYTAGEPQEFGELQVYYSRVVTGNWTSADSWSTDPILQHTGAAALVPPVFNPVVIATGHTITGNTNNLGSPTAEINGTLNLNNTIGHNFGIVTGTGTLRMTPTAANEFIFPGGTYSAFTSAGSGTIEYSSGTTAALPSRTTYNNITFTGTGTKNLFNSDILVNGNFTISQGQVNNIFNRLINVRGNFTNSAGFTSFIGGTGVVNMSGTAQSFNGASQFTNLVISGGGIKTLNSSIQINNLLTLTNGILETGGNNVIIPATGNVVDASNASYVNGFLQKSINNTMVSKSFEVGDATRYAPVNLNFTGAIIGAGSLTIHTTAGDNTNIATSGLNPARSVNRNWNITVTSLNIASYNATFNFNAADVDAGSNTNAFEIARYDGSWNTTSVGARTVSSTQVIGLNNVYGDFQIGEQLGSVITWTGIINSDWHNAGNWLPSFVPGLSDDVLIPNTVNKPNFPTLANGNCRSIVLEPLAFITIPQNVTLAIGGNWAGSNTTVFGSGKVRFTSPSATLSGVTTFSGIVEIATGANLTTNNGFILANNGSLMHGASTPGAGGNVTGNVRIRRTGTSSNTSYNYWSAPISNANLNLLPNQNRYRYNANFVPNNSPAGLLAGWRPASGAMVVGEGFIATGAGTVTFDGIANDGGISYGPLTVAANSSMNLVGNPYPSALSASAFVTANTGRFIGGALYFWDDDNSGGVDFTNDDYGTYNIVGFTGPNSGTVFNGNIASCQSFVVLAQNTSNVVFNNTMRTTQNNAFFSFEDIEKLWISVTNDANSYNETLLAFMEQATDGFDIDYDAPKLFGSNALAVSSMIDGGHYAIQARSTLNIDKMIQLSVRSNVSGPQVMKLKELQNFSNSAQIILEDTKLNVFHNLRVNDTYNYVYDKDNDEFRFRIHFKPSVTINTSIESCAQNDGSITIHSPSNTVWNYSVTNQQNMVVAQGDNLQGTTTVNNLTGGNYMVNLSNQFGNVQEFVTIAVGSPVVASIAASANTVNLTNATVNFTSMVNGSTDITWDFGDGTIITDVANPTHMYTEPGIYTVTFIASSANCMDVKTLSVRVIDNTTGVSDMDKLSISIFPNPARDLANIRINLPNREHELTVFVIDNNGKLVSTKNFKDVESKGNIILDVSTFEPGVYQLIIKGDSFSTNKKLTVIK